MPFDRLPLGVELHDGEEVAARPAASVLLLQDAGATLEVLLARRAATLGHMAGYWVFPGGVVAPGDADLRATARRETREEVGIAITDELVLFSRWITPARAARRFDTRFYVTRAPDGQLPEADGTECVEWRWLAPSAAIAAAARHELLIVLPTLKTLERLATFTSVEDALATARSTDVEPIQPWIVDDGGRQRAVLPGEAGYQ